jgi:outer membrane protein assembly factor BamA
LFYTRLFSGVNYRLEPAGGDSVDVIIKVEERSYGFYSLGIRYDTDDDVALGVEVGQGNLGGSGASLRAALDVGNPDEIRLGLTGTTLFWTSFGYRVDGFLGTVRRWYSDSDRWRGAYSVCYRGAVAEAGYILGHSAFFDVGMRGYLTSYDMPSDFPRDSFFLGQPDWIVGPSFRLETSTFPDVNFPQRGMGSKLDVLSSLTSVKGTHQFLRLGYSAEWGIPFRSRLLLRPGLDFGMSFGDLALVEQFRTGGAEFVGFEPEEFTSAQRVVVRFGVDVLAFRLFGQENYPIYVQALSNAGSFEPWDGLFGDSGLPFVLHWGVGIGARTNTPLGPVQIIAGMGDIDSKLSDLPSTRAVTFSVGREFRYTR